MCLILTRIDAVIELPVVVIFGLCVGTLDGFGIIGEVASAPTNLTDESAEAMFDSTPFIVVVEVNASSLAAMMIALELISLSLLDETSLCC